MIQFPKFSSLLIYEGARMIPSPQQVTQLLVDWRNANRAALDELMPLVSNELRMLARRYSEV